MRLYEIDDEIAKIMESIEEADGIMTDEQENQLMFLDVERSRKITSIVFLIKEAEAAAEVVESEQKRLQERRKSFEALSARLRHILAYSVPDSGFKSELVSVSKRKSTSVVVSEEPEALEALLRMNLAKSITKIQPDKKAIKQVLEAGGAINLESFATGSMVIASLETKDVVTIR